jgi:ATP-binding cassette subfamily B multidrug efflux pump
MLLIRRLLPHLRRYWPAFVAGFVCVVVSNYLRMLGPRYLQQGIDALARPDGQAAVRRAIALMLAVGVVGGVMRFGMRMTLNSVSRRIETDLRDQLFAHFTRLSAAFYDRYPTGDLMARATNDLLNVRMVAGPGVMYLSDTLVGAAFVLPFMARLDPTLTAVTLAPLVLLPVGMVVFGRAIHRRTTAAQAAFSDLTTAVHENLSGARIVRAYRQEATELERFRTINRGYAARNLALARVAGAFHPLLALLGGLGGVAVIWIGGNLVIQGTLTAGQFVAFGVYLVMLVWPMIALGWVVNLVQRGAASMGRLAELFDSEPVITSPAHPTPLPRTKGARSVTFEGVWFRYPTAPERGWVLQDVSFTLPAGQALGVVGATGAGKSTLAELLLRTYDPDRGRLLLDGVDLRALDLRTLHQAIGVVPQETFLFSDTIRGNVLLGAPDDGRLERAAEVSQLAAALPELPKGYDTLLGERGINLSGGQRQRAAIARALAQDPPVFILDDALSAVDGQTEARILARLRGALARRTRIIISHRLSAVRDADQILVLEGGRIVERGTHAELMALRGRYHELLWRQEMEAELEEAAEAS